MVMCNWSSDVCSSELAGIVDEDVDRAEFFDRLINDTMIVRGAADVAVDNVAAPTFSFDHLPRFMRVVAGESILDDDIRAFAREPDCNPAADAPATAGDRKSTRLNSSH